MLDCFLIGRAGAKLPRHVFSKIPESSSELYHVTSSDLSRGVDGVVKLHKGPVSGCQVRGYNSFFRDTACVPEGGSGVDTVYCLLSRGVYLQVQYYQFNDIFGFS